LAPKLGAGQALAHLRRLCAETLFQPETPDAPIQVLGIFESAGLEFDALWVSGLTDEAWPLAAQPSPFIPPALQRKAGIPEASAEGALALDKRITDDWMSAAGEVVLSHARRERDRELAPSPLIASLPVGSIDLPEYASHRDLLYAARTLEEIPDGNAPPIFASARVGAGQVVLIAASPWQASVVALVDPDTGKVTVLRESASLAIADEYISPPEAIEFPTGGGQLAHAFWYAPRNPNFRAPHGELPPLVVIGHGGPTGATTPSLNLATQFWTSRGFAVLDVNYRGSTGYGRTYRELLRGLWGVADVEDCVDGAMYLVAQGRADEKRLAIRGGSAGGFTALAALTFYDAFKAGASYYGIGDLEALARDTHKFESRYTDSLVGPYPERKDLYEARSPIHSVDQLSCPVIFFQGLADKVVPPNQAETMVDALRAKGLPVAYLAFEGEQHGFRRAETIIRAREAELYFYGKVFGFAPADKIDPVPIENL